MTVSNLGADKDNFAQWNNVFSENGGTYKMKIKYIPAELQDREINDHKIEVTVNGTTTRLSELETDSSKGIATAELDINLDKGYNTIKIGSRRTWVPDIDCFELEKISNKM